MDYSTTSAAGDFCPISATDQRQIRRMISKPESARRSRMRKQRYLEDLRRRIGRHRLENRALPDRLVAISQCCATLFHENQRLAVESAALRRRLSEISRTVFFRELQRLSSLPVATGDGIVAADGQIYRFS